MADSPSSWLRELGMEDPLMSLDPCGFMASMDGDFASPLGEDFQQYCCFSSESNSSSNSTNLLPNIVNSSSTTNLSSASISSSMELAPQIVVESSTKHQKHNASSSSRFILSFGNSNDTLPENPQRVPANPEDEVVSSFLMSQQGSRFVNHEDGTMKSGKLGVKRKSSDGGGGNSRPPSQTYDHIIAERKRREQLSQLFVALSSIVPGLKKTDKTSVLGEGVKYLKQLQERVKTLEDQTRKQTIESVVLVKKSQLSFADDHQSCSDENITGRSSELQLPEIEAKVCNKNILLRVHCERRKGLLVKLLGELEKLNLVVVHTSVAPFGSLALDITVIAEMETEFGITMKDLVKSLRPALQHFMAKNAG